MAPSEVEPPEDVQKRRSKLGIGKVVRAKGASQIAHAWDGSYVKGTSLSHEGCGMFYWLDVWVVMRLPAEVRTLLGRQRGRAIDISLDDPKAFAAWVAAAVEATSRPVVLVLTHRNASICSVFQY